MSNAVSSRAGRRINIDLTRNGRWLELVVRDNGQGISRDFLPYVFDRFRQADATPSRRHGGLGLGLALVRQIVELHGGTVSVESAGTGHGAAFAIRLPVMSDAVLQRGAPIGAAPVTLGDITVLVVDDNEDSRDMLAVMLGEYGARVRTATSVDEAWTLLDGGALVPDVLVSDVGSPAPTATRCSGESGLASPELGVSCHRRHRIRQSGRRLC